MPVERTEVIWGVIGDENWSDKRGEMAAGRADRKRPELIWTCAFPEKGWAEPVLGGESNFVKKS
jgi:hypothetical protein